MKIKELIAAITTKPGNLEAHHELVSCYLDAGKQGEAIKCLQNIIRLWPKNVEAYRISGAIYRKQEDWVNAGKMFKRLTELVPERVPPWVLLAYVFDELNNNKEAIKCCKKALSIKPDAEGALRILSSSLIKDEQPDQAKVVLERLVSLYPDTVQEKYMLSALSGNNQPEHSPAEYVKNVFDDFADNFENMLVNKLDYHVPDLLDIEIRNQLVENNNQLNTLDLGCGTGLMGARLRNISKYMVGVDLSEKMLLLAEQKNIYDELSSKDVLDYLSHADKNFDLIIAADVFVYIGELSEIFEKTYQAMRAGGMFCFSTEMLDDGNDYALRNTCRYAHDNQYISKLAVNNGFQLCLSKKIIVRMEKHKPVDGCLFIYLKP